MISKIAALLRDEISGLNFVEIAAGLAKPVIVRNNATKIDADDPAMIDKVVPMAYNDLGVTCEEGDLYKLVPDTKKKSILWWEDNGIELIEEQTYYYQARASLTLVAWWNLPLINETLSDASLLVANLIAAIPARLPNVDYLSQIRVQWTGEQVSGAEVLSKYTFDEAENQFATYPYQVTGLNFTVDFAFGKNCVGSAIIDKSECPPKMEGKLCELLDFDGVDDFVELDALVTGIYGSKTVSFYCKIPSASDLSGGRVIFAFSDAVSSDGLIIYLYGTSPKIMAFIKPAGLPKYIELAGYFDKDLYIEVTKTATEVSSVKINNETVSLIAGGAGINSPSAKHIGCRLFAGNEDRFYEGLIWNIGIDGIVYWKGYPAGNTNAAWEDQVGSNDGTVNGNPSTAIIC